MTPQISQADTGHQAGSVVLTGSADVKTISEYYEKQMADKAWKQENNTSSGRMAMQIYTKDDRQAVIIVNGDGKTSSVSITYKRK